MQNPPLHTAKKTKTAPHVKLTRIKTTQNTSPQKKPTLPRLQTHINNQIHIYLIKLTKSKQTPTHKKKKQQKETYTIQNTK